jgi:hypothetical protein
MFPKDTLVYGGLSTSFTSFDSLLSDLGGRRHTGFVEVVHPGYSGVLFMTEGEVVNACVQQADGRGTGKVAAKSVAERAAQKNGTINVWASTPDMVLLLHRLTDSRPLYRDLTSAFTSLDRLIAKLRGDGLTGYVEVEFGSGEGGGYVYLSDGEPVQTVYSVDNQTMTGRDALNAIMNEVATAGGTFSVYVEGSAEPAPATGVAAVASEPATSPAESKHEEVIAFWEDVLARTEEAVDSVAKPGRFLLAFGKCWLRRPSLSLPRPIRGRVRYTAGRITSTPRPISARRSAIA